MGNYTWNRKKQKKGYEIQLNEAKNYEIEVKAKDFAGNEKVSQIGFEIYEEKSLWQKIVEPVRKYIFYADNKKIHPLYQGRLIYYELKL